MQFVQQDLTHPPRDPASRAALPSLEDVAEPLEQGLAGFVQHARVGLVGGRLIRGCLCVEGVLQNRSIPQQYAAPGRP